MVQHTHQYFTKGIEEPAEAVRILTEVYSLNYKGGVTYMLRGDDFSLRFTGKDEFSITLIDQHEEFVPDKTRLEFKVIGHFLHVAGTERLLYWNSKPLDDAVFQALLDCYKDPQSR